LKTSYFSVHTSKEAQRNQTSISLALSLASEKIIRGRTVYNLIELVSEFSGLYDIFNLIAGLFLVFFTRQIQKTELIEEMVQARGRKPAA
jgi:hypothetical protein